MSYCIDGHAPYFATVRDARKHIIDSGSTDGVWVDERRKVIATVCNEDGQGIGWVTRMPFDDMMSPSGYFWDSKRVGYIVQLDKDGEIVEDSGNVLVCRMEEANYILCTPYDDEMYFYTLEHLAKAFMRMHRYYTYPEMQGHVIKDKDGNRVGTVMSFEKGGLLEIDGKLRNINRDGTLGSWRKDLAIDRENHHIIKIRG